MLSSVLIIVAAIVGVVVAAILYIYGRFGRRPHGLPSTALPVAEAGTELDRLIMPLLAGRPNANGVALVSDSIEALVVRAHAARRAGRSLDLQYYYWKDDLTGLLLAREIDSPHGHRHALRPGRFVGLLHDLEGRVLAGA